MKSPLLLSRNQVRRIDELAQRNYGLAGIVLMENAGRGAAAIIDQEYGPQGDAVIACGTGNNGGDGLVIARHLHNSGWSVRVLIAGNSAVMSADCATNDRVVLAMHLDRFVAGDGEAEALWFKSIDQRTVVIDALLGTGFEGVVRPRMAELIERLNSLPRRAMVSIDVPSGMDCDTGLPGGTAIRADLTLTFVTIKPGFLTDSGRGYTGRWHVVDIGVPRELIGEVAGDAAGDAC